MLETSGLELALGTGCQLGNQRVAAGCSPLASILFHLRVLAAAGCIPRSQTQNTLAVAFRAVPPLVGHVTTIYGPSNATLAILRSCWRCAQQVFPHLLHYNDESRTTMMGDIQDLPCVPWTDHAYMQLTISNEKTPYEKTVKQQRTCGSAREALVRRAIYPPRPRQTSARPLRHAILRSSSAAPTALFRSRRRIQHSSARAAASAASAAALRISS
jgi:hypothetical protein